jgi:oligosaccharide repeat unit polymerase
MSGRRQAIMKRLLDSNPFVSISKRQWISVLGTVLLYLILIGFLNLLDGGTNILLIYEALLVKVGLLLLPFAIARRKNWGWFHPLVFIGLWMFVRRVIPQSFVFIEGLQYHEELALSASRLNVLVTYELLLDALALGFTYVGYIIAPQFRVPTVHFGEPQWTRVKIGAIGLLSLYAFYVLVSAAGGIGPLILERGEGLDRVQSQVGGYWIIFTHLLRTSCLVWFAVRPSVGNNVTFWVLFVFSLAIGFGATGSRSGVIWPVLLIIIIWSLHNHRIPFVKIAMAGVIGIFLVGALGEFRSDRSLEDQPITDTNLDVSFVEGLRKGIETFSRYSSSSASIYPIIESVPERHRLLLGESYLSIPALPIPRKIWPNKPPAAGNKAGAVFFGNPDTGKPPGAVGEAYWNFWIPGVIVVFLLWGVFLKWLTRLFLQNRHSRGMVLLYALTILVLSPHSPTVYEWVFAVVPFGVILVFICGPPHKSTS